MERDTRHLNELIYARDRDERLTGFRVGGWGECIETEGVEVKPRPA